MKNLKQWNFKLQALLLCGICSCGILSSCSNSEDLSNKTGSAIGKQLVLTINTANPNGPQASALPNTLKNVKIGSRATNLTSNSVADQINRLTVGIFSNDGKTVRTIQELTSGTGTGKFNTTSGTTKADIVTTSLENGDQIVVAANAPSGEFNGVQSVTDFEARTLTIDQALATADGSSKPGTTEVTNNIPMYSNYTAGTPYTIAQSGNDYTATVALQHQLAEITVSSVGVQFDQSGPYKNATFQPTAFFLINVANDLNFSSNAWDAAATAASSTHPANQGYSSTTTTGLTDLKTYPNKEYLTTGSFASGVYPVLSYTGTSATATLGTPASTPVVNPTNGSIVGSATSPLNIFYVTPNFNTAQNTKLVIEGTFKSDGTDATKSTVYYPVNINWVYDSTTKTSSAATDGGATAKAVYPNKNYKCSIIIKTKGATDPYTTIDPEVASILVTVSKFDDVNQSTEFDY